MHTYKSSVQNWWTEFKTGSAELRKLVERDLMLRRYQKWTQGQTPWEDRVVDQLVKVVTLVETSWRAILKRILDFSVAAAGLIVALPVMAAVAIAIKIESKGPVFYRQTRVGMKGKLFTMIKFRSMVHDAETSSGPVWAKTNDPRITKLGAFLRATHLDEIPQLWNVFKGEMSLVGPRPERPYFVNEFKKTIPNYEMRLCAKPGITGLAQVRNGYDETIRDVKKKVRYDILYIQKMCPLLDVKVIAMTALAVFLKTGR